MLVDPVADGDCHEEAHLGVDAVLLGHLQELEHASERNAHADIQTEDNLSELEAAYSPLNFDHGILSH